jgi:hypothetical protein
VGGLYENAVPDVLMPHVIPEKVVVLLLLAVQIVADIIHTPAATEKLVRAFIPPEPCVENNTFDATFASS